MASAGLAAGRGASTATAPPGSGWRSGIPAMGQRDVGQLAKMLPASVRYVGVGVGKRWNRAFMKAAAERTNGVFTQINPDEVIAWRAFDLLATLNTPRLLDVRTAGEWAAEHIEGALHIPLPGLPRRLAELPRHDPLAVICGSGYRSSIAASLLREAGFSRVQNVMGGMSAYLDWDGRR